MNIQRGMILDLQLDPARGSDTAKTRPCIVISNNIYNARVPVIQVTPITQWSKKKAAILTNVTLSPSPENGLSKASIADCLQTRPVDWRQRFVKIRGRVSADQLKDIEQALKKVFAL